jgi:hypothetical protein
MQPCSAVQSVFLYNSTDAKGEWIPTEVEVDSWVALMLGKTGGLAKDTKNTVGTTWTAATSQRFYNFSSTMDLMLSKMFGFNMLTNGHSWTWTLTCRCSSQLLAIVCCIFLPFI